MTSADSTKVSMQRQAMSIVIRLAAGAIGWWALAEGDSSMYGYGIVVVPLATAVSWWILPPKPSAATTGFGARLSAILRLAGWFAGRSLLGGIDVARRAISDKSAIDPIYESYTLQLDSDGAQVLITQLMNLMPGSLSVELENGTVLLHSLHPELPVIDQMAELERRVAAALGTPLGDSDAAN